MTGQAPAVTQAQAAAMLGVGTRRVKQIVQDGNGPDQTANGSFPADAFGRWFRQRILSEAGVANDGEAYDLNAEKGRLTKAQADKTELEVAELQGELVRVPEVVDAWSTHVAAARAKLLSLPSKIAPRVAGPGKVAETQELMRGIIDEALNELAGDGLPERTRSRLTRAEGVAGATETDGKPVGGRVSAVKPRSKRRAGTVVNSKG